MALLSSALISFIVGAGVTSSFLLIRRKTQLARAKTKENGEKYIEITNAFFWIMYGGGVAFSVLGMFVYLFSNEPMASIYFFGIGVVCILFSVLFQFVDTTVNWTSEYICGPKSGISWKKNCIFWKDVAFVKYLPNNNIQITDNLGNSVCWSYLQNGWHEIIDDLRLIRPDIDTSDFDGLS